MSAGQRIAFGVPSTKQPNTDSFDSRSCNLASLSVVSFSVRCEPSALVRPTSKRRISYSEPCSTIVVRIDWKLPESIRWPSASTVCETIRLRLWLRRDGLLQGRDADFERRMRLDQRHEALAAVDLHRRQLRLRVVHQRLVHLQ